jgi:serine protease AprX
LKVQFASGEYGGAGQASLGETWIHRRASRAGSARRRALAAGGLSVAMLAAFGAATGTASAAVAPTATVRTSAAPATGPTARYVIRANPKQGPALAAELRRLGVHVDATIGLIDAVVAPLPTSLATALASDPLVAEVTPDGPVQLESGAYDSKSDPNSIFNAADLVGAHDAWGNGYTGQGVDVALIDSGVTPVEGLADPSQVVNGPDLSFESQLANTQHLDTFGHGTFMAGLIAGRDPGVDARATDSTDYQGMAPDARIVSVKVADAQGRSDVSQVIAGIDWVVQHAHDPGMNIRVLNLSFGTDSKQSYLMDPLAYAAEVAWRKGIVVVVSAGNSGSTALADPAMDPFVIAVGALDTNGTLTARDDKVASFSAKGTSARHPDVIAPGVHVQGLRVPGSFIDTQFGSTGRLGTRFFRGNGTSEAAAITSGVVALVLSHQPNLTPDQVKHLLMSTARKTAVTSPGQGSGLVNAARAAVALPGATVQQKFSAAKGTGSLQGSRGSNALTLGGVALTGEQDIFGKPVVTSRLAAQESAMTAWTGGSWNGSVWTGASWDGINWAGASWDGASWDGASWDGASWDGATWDGASWDGASWDGATWDGATWDGASWSGASWNAVTTISAISAITAVITQTTWDSTNWMGGSWS